MDSGADVLVAAPVSPALILDRIDSLVNNRKPFVVTSEYNGPGRRFLNDRESEIELINVPKSLREKALGQFNTSRHKDLVAATRAIKRLTDGHSRFRIWPIKLFRISRMALSPTQGPYPRNREGDRRSQIAFVIRWRLGT